ncbi:MAG: DUF2807 domain-containing protein [Bacteroidaceae bacterium]|nr:DUF2807 domain-containing protein [Bacteroidaceae bacterium]
MTLSLSIMALAVTLFTGCNAEKGQEGGIKEWFFPSEKTAEGKITQTEGEIVTKEFDIKNFTGLDIGYNTEVTYVQGNTYKVEVKTTEKVFNSLQVKKKNGVLTLEFPFSTPNKVKNEKIHVHVTAPEINSFELSGVSKLHSEEFTAGKLMMDISGTSVMTVGNIDCTEADIDCSGASKIIASINAKGDADIDCSGACTMKVKLEAQVLDLDFSGATKGSLDIVSDDLEMEISGASKIDGSFKGKRMNLECSGTGKIDFNVDCEQLKAENSGVAKVKISGTADDVKVNSSGVSKIDTSNLNQL